MNFWIHLCQSIQLRTSRQSPKIALLAAPHETSRDLQSHYIFFLWGDWVSVQNIKAMPPWSDRLTPPSTTTARLTRLKTTFCMKLWTTRDSWRNGCSSSGAFTASHFGELLEIVSWAESLLFDVWPSLCEMPYRHVFKFIQRNWKVSLRPTGMLIPVFLRAEWTYSMCSRYI